MDGVYIVSDLSDDVDRLLLADPSPMLNGTPIRGGPLDVRPTGEGSFRSLKKLRRDRTKRADVESKQPSTCRRMTNATTRTDS